MPTPRDLLDRAESGPAAGRGVRPVAIGASPPALSSSGSPGSGRREMAKVAVIGESGKVLEFGLAGAIVLPAEEPEAVLAAWRSLGEDVAVVVLTSRAARTLAGRTASWPLTAVMPP
jgi:ATP synthase F subunit